MNERDSEAVAAQLVAKGYSMTADALTADVILLNTCSVRDAAEQKALGKMSHVAGQLRSKNRKAVLGFMGCMAQSRGRELIDKLPDVDLVVGTQKFHRTADHIGDLIAGRTGGVVDTGEEKGSEATIREHLLTARATKNRSLRSSASCRGATSFARSASCRTRVAGSGAGRSTTSSASAASW
ncbi:MAG TPA: hypothetical protein QF373_07630 [Verrucomicrobiota bacterium]|nr:hypothetical protein [Verrucomicrobiota bacterium]